jgi:hypothetical protein
MVARCLPRTPGLFIDIVVSSQEHGIQFSGECKETALKDLRGR